MCNKIYIDKNGKNEFNGETICDIIPHIKQSILGNSIITLLDPENSNAKIESMPNIWKLRGMIWVQTKDKIESFLEQTRLIRMNELLDMYTIAVMKCDGSGLYELRVVTRADGASYFKKHKIYPPFVTKEVAKEEHLLCERWPLYRKRIL